MGNEKYTKQGDFKLWVISSELRVYYRIFGYLCAAKLMVEPKNSILR
jgi:hypothetical protein